MQRMESPSVFAFPYVSVRKTCLRVEYGFVLLERSSLRNVPERSFLQLRCLLGSSCNGICRPADAAFGAKNFPFVRIGMFLQILFGRTVFGKLPWVTPLLCLYYSTKIPFVNSFSEKIFKFLQFIF